MEASLTRSLHRTLAVVVLVVTLLSWWGLVLFSTDDHTETSEPFLFNLLFGMTFYNLIPAFALLGTTLYTAVVGRSAREALTGIAVLVFMFLMAKNGMSMMQLYD
ncbi:hypothetical protein [Hymenobacter terrestris]|uniref:DUF1705 domain-containing protein n=2 Tax=Hymenobacter terrestris TaxID=2748310 RepID=A0ABX2Q9L5_9BACT|nr:hypothetical protein [Hymenobacter terrestris]NVO86399.1 hypothetical protein [Hymenobacter terrestris]